MKTLWFTNKPFPEASALLGLPPVLSQGWLLDLAHRLSEIDDFELHIASLARISKTKKVSVGSVTHHLLPEPGRLHGKRYYDKCLTALRNEVAPDIVHIFGTESDIGDGYLRLYPEDKVILTIQGVIDRICDEYYGGLSTKDLILNRTLRENLRCGGIIFARQKLKHQKKIEARVLSKVKYVTGRTLWDYSVMKRINPSLKYQKCNFNLRSEFYDAPKWDMSEANRHTIYTSYADYPLKGLHVLLRALAIIKLEYSDVKLMVPGVKCDASNKLVVNTGYKKYISSLMKKLGLENNVEFTGALSPDAVIDKMRHSHVTVVSSAIEGASATACEAMFLGVPCICAYRGGMTELLQDGVDGYYYDYPEYAYLAERIKMIFADDETAVSFSKNTITKAEKRHDRQKNVEDYKNLYLTVSQE